ncbi:MAG: hypothetical protein Q9227_002679 [Pyrenula ochraceoflavens]
MSSIDQLGSTPPSDPQDMPPSQLASKSDGEPTTSTPVEMSTLESKRDTATSSAADPSPSNTGNPSSVDPAVDKENHPPSSNENTDNSAKASPSGGAGALPPASNPTPPSIVTRQMSTQIGPAADSPISLPKEGEAEGPTLAITLLLTNGNRHPFKLDSSYLQKRNVKVPANDPFNISVYTLKELILREWRNGCKLNHDAPNVIHMTIKPQEIIDEEDAKGGKGGFGTGSARDGGERSPGCRCVLL